MNYPIQQTELYQELKDLASISPQKADRRVQLVMPKRVVELLDQEFPQKSRSRLLTEAAVDLLLRKLRVNDPELEHWVAEEQIDLDQMWVYLEKRDQR